jgi:hypothetical protein
MKFQFNPGKDATFTLVEDDGETTSYLKQQIRRTAFHWDNAAGLLTWKREGDYSGKDVFKKIHVVLFDPRKKLEARHALSAQGSLALGAPR